MPKIKPLQGEQLALDELLPDATKSDHKPPKKAFKKRALYRVKEMIKETQPPRLIFTCQFLS